MSEGRPSFDIANLPKHGFDTRAPIWWGNLLLLMIETTMFGILVASYFYISQNFNLWPPPRSEAHFLTDTNPTLLIPTINLILLLVSCVPMSLTDRSARLGKRGSTLIGLLLCLLLGVASFVLRWFEFYS